MGVVQLNVQFLTSWINNPNSDIITNRFFSVVGPLLFLIAGLQWIIGGKIQKALLQRADDYQEKRIRIRPYGLVRISCIALSLIITICYFAINACYIDAMFYVCILTAYTLFKLETVFSKKYHFTKKYLTYCSWGKKHKVALRDIYYMRWDAPRSGMGYLLVFSFPGVSYAQLSTAEFYGVKQLKEAYDQQKRKVAGETVGVPPTNMPRLKIHKT